MTACARACQTPAQLLFLSILRTQSQSLHPRECTRGKRRKHPTEHNDNCCWLHRINISDDFSQSKTDKAL